MKKILLFILIFLTATVYTTAQQNIPCCPDFTIDALNGLGRECCTKCTAVADSLGTAGGGQQQGSGCTGSPVVACKNSWGRFEVYPNLPGFSYQWTITGGSPTTITGNPVNILWGNGTTGSITVVITGPGCTKTITRKVCLLDKPKADFTYSPPSNICANTLITFTNTSSGGVSFTWFFGDGTSSTDANPQHQYGTAGSYTVSLVVSSASGGGAVPQGGGCGCVDTIKKVIVVGNGPGIETCNKMLCPGDYAEYCSTLNCSGYTWSITGGTIIGPANQKCVKVQWNTAPGSLTLTTTGCGPCNTTTIIPSVIWPTLPITGPSPVCVGSTNSYSLPVIPGTFYSWSISPAAGATIMSGGLPYPNNYPVNNPTVNINFTQAGTYTLTGNYTNPNTKKKCGGTGSITITVLPKFNIYGPGSVCQNTSGTYGTTDGSAATWSITPGSGYSPLSFPNGPSINVNWLTPGNYVLTSVPVTGSNYCNPTGVSIAIQVKPAPVLSFVTPQTLVCPNSLVNYSVTSTLPGNVTWSFTTGTGNIYPFGTDNKNASVDFTGPGPWVLKAKQTVNSCDGSVSVSISKVAPPPAISLSTSPVCAGGTVIASVTGSIPPGGYTWSCNSGGVLTGGQGTLSGTFAINSATVITLTSCGGSSTITVPVTTMTASIVKTNTACGATLTVSPAPGGTTYQWFKDGVSFPGGNPLNITQNGTYVVAVTYPGNCKATASYTVTGLNPVTVVISGIGNICNGNQVTLSASVSAGCTVTNYAWSNGSSGPALNSISVGTAGSYSVTVTCSNGCTATSNVLVVPACTTGSGNCINDLTINGNNNCNNPVNLSVNAPPGCTPVSTTWYYGDGYSGPTGVHQYNTIGNYQVLVVIKCADGTYHCGTLLVKIPMVDDWTYVISCGINGWNVALNNASLALPSHSSYSTTWSATPACATIASPTSANTTMFVPFGCNPVVNLQISANGCTLNKSFAFSFPATSLAINGNNNPCINQDNIYSSNYTTGVIAYNWNFGDGSTGVGNPITHHFDGTNLSPTITLTITDQWGCQFTTTLPVTVKVPPALTITPASTVKICPDCPPVTTTLTASPAGFTGYQWYHNGAQISGANSSTYQVCPGAGIGSYYVTANSATGPGGPCPQRSDTVKVVNHPKPDAVISPRNVQCVGAFPTTVSYIQSGAMFNTNYTYTWYLNNTGNQIFTSTTTNFLTYTIPSAACYVFIVKVTDNVTGCVAYDTACICFSQTPTVNIVPAGSLCAGTTHTLIASAGPLPVTQYTYVWQDGTLGQNYITSFAGNYTVTASNIYGCSNTASKLIKPLPYVALFPQGCDTLCLGDSLFFPLPLDNGGNPSYTITWYEGSTVIGTGFSIPLTGLGLGAHTIHATVVMNGCTVTTAKLYLVIINCTPCDCKESHWGETEIVEGDKPNAKGGPMAGISAAQVNPKANTGTGQGAGKPIQLNCGVAQKLDCNKTYTVSSTYICKDTACAGKVTYSLQPPTGSPITGTGTITFTTSMTGTYILTMYGWCGDKICDTCVIDLVVDCNKCDCKGSKWGERMITMNNATKNFKCGDVFDVKCKQPVTINANYLCADPACNGAVTYSLQPPSGAPTTGSIPPAFTFTPMLNGNYTLTLYGWCGTTICDSCVIKFKAVCEPEPCCIYDIKATTGTVKYDYTQIPNATVAAQTFTINGLGLASITEVAASVVSYAIDDNYKSECMKCVNLPFTWASVASASNIGAVPADIMMYGPITVASFNGSGVGAYKNPREVVWNNGTLIAIPNGTNIGMNFILPPVPAIDCCELKGKICVKFIFRDINCRECEVIVCFDFVIKKK